MKRLYRIPHPHGRVWVLVLPVSVFQLPANEHAGGSDQGPQAFTSLPPTWDCVPGLQSQPGPSPSYCRNLKLSLYLPFSSNIKICISYELFEASEYWFILYLHNFNLKSFFKWKVWGLVLWQNRLLSYYRNIAHGCWVKSQQLPTSAAPCQHAWESRRWPRCSGPATHRRPGGSSRAWPWLLRHVDTEPESRRPLDSIPLNLPFK